MTSASVPRDFLLHLKDHILPNVQKDNESGLVTSSTVRFTCFFQKMTPNDGFIL